LIVSDPKSIKAEEITGDRTRDASFDGRGKIGAGFQGVGRTAKCAGFCEILVQDEGQGVPRFESSWFEFQNQVR
jgi:hypothetical protein